ncbi:NAD(P)/FAD-dependent oxidoreductase [Pseudonocardiaceae bacterium YIM PH 21723]|nr:NAD(P)/FAD-dependent oxidoreductase [Pseudonocardiaceae bacterium YIM PH 21723]
MNNNVDVVVIGLGPGGEDLATRLAKAGRSVVAVEGRLVGGECPYYGCVPTKMMIRAAQVLAEGRRIDGLAGSAEVRPDWTTVATRIRQEATDNWNDQVAVDRLEKAGVRFVRGWGKITAPGQVTVSTPDGEQVFQASRGIAVNPGTAPAVPGLEGLADTPFWTNRDAVATEEVPASLIVLGGGPIGAEFAQVFARFGAQVTVVQSADRLLPRDEPEAGALLAEVFTAEGITVRTGARAQRVVYNPGEFTLHMSDGAELRAQQLLVAAGRKVDLAGLGVGAFGLDESARTIPVDDRMRAADGLWAIGDIAGEGAFTHVSMYQARIAANDILGVDGEPANYRALPWVTFTEPEVGAVGLTEQAARDKGIRVRTGITQVPSSTRGWIHKGEGFIKLVEDADRGVLIGATSAGPVGGEVLGALAVAVQGEVPVATLSEMIWAYPTFHRAIGEAVNDLTKQ